jgi:2-succinyl-5-enolpyruvyl-6-hydroxy-3-cyclohexene-1-carboxylate synthase
VLRFGAAPTSTAVGDWIARHGARRTMVVDPAGQWRDPHHVASQVVAANPVGLCEDLMAKLEGFTSTTWRARWSQVDAAAAEVMHLHAAQGNWEGGVARVVAEAVPDGGLLHMASSMPIRDLDGFAAEMETDVAVAANRGACGIDGLLACTLGEASAWSGPVVAVAGDLSFLHDVGSLLLARGVDSPVTVVVVDNGGGAIFGFLPIASNEGPFERRFLTPQGQDITAICHGFGVRAWTATAVEELATALDEVMERPGVDIIHLRVDREENQARHEVAWAEASEAAQQALGLGS